MDPKTITPEEVQKKLAEVVASVEATRQTMLKALSANIQAEAKILRLEKEELLKTADPKDPRVKALDRRLIGAERVVDFAETSLRAVKRGRAVKPKDLVFTGRVADARGRPLEGLRVELVDEQGKFADRLAAVTTDANGEFFVRHAEKDIADLIAQTPKLFVRVLDKEGKELHRTAEPIEPKLDSITGFDVRLRAAPDAKSKAPKQDDAASLVSSATKKKTPKKKPNPKRNKP